jgi:hypothetical protein
MTPQWFFIAGCQRSGTTLLRLVLECHSQIEMYDEARAYATIAGDGPAASRPGITHIGFKIPRWSEQLLDPLVWDEGMAERVPQFYDRQPVVFIVRDLLDSVASMVKLKFEGREWLRLYGVPSLQAKIDASRAFREAFASDIRTMEGSQSSLVAAGALYWKFKNLALFRYLKHGLNVLPVRYEDLTVQSEPIVRRICSFLDIPFEPGMLNHPQFEHGETNYRGRVIGNTDPTVSIHTNSVAQWKSAFNTGEVQTILEIGGKLQSFIEDFFEVGEVLQPSRQLQVQDGYAAS